MNKYDPEEARFYAQLRAETDAKDKGRAVPSIWRDMAIGGLMALGLFVVGMAVLVTFVPRDAKPQPARAAVENSQWDGSVGQVKEWLGVNLKDPSSVQYIEWDTVQRLGGGGYSVRVKYRAKNSFGAYAVETKIFFLGADGTVTNCTDD